MKIFVSVVDMVNVMVNSIAVLSDVHSTFKSLIRLLKQKKVYHPMLNVVSGLINVPSLIQLINSGVTGSLSSRKQFFLCRYVFFIQKLDNAFRR